MEYLLTDAFAGSEARLCGDPRLVAWSHASPDSLPYPIEFVEDFLLLC
jgi:hypothetical protein